MVGSRKILYSLASFVLMAIFSILITIISDIAPMHFATLKLNIFKILRGAMFFALYSVAGLIALTIYKISSANKLLFYQVSASLALLLVLFHHDFTLESNTRLYYLVRGKMNRLYIGLTTIFVSLIGFNLPVLVRQKLS